MSSSNEIFCVNKNYLNVDIDSSSNEIDLACKYFVNIDDNNFKERTYKTLRRRIKRRFNRNFRKIIFFRSPINENGGLRIKRFFKNEPQKNFKWWKEVLYSSYL